MSRQNKLAFALYYRALKPNGDTPRTPMSFLPTTARRAAAVLLFACVALGASPYDVVGQDQAPAQAQHVFADGEAQIVPAFEDKDSWIREELWVETEFDSDGDGDLDRVHVAVTRPGQTESEGLKVPVIYGSSPYYSGTSGARQYLWDVRQELGEPSPTRTNQPAPNRRTRPIYFGWVHRDLGTEGICSGSLGVTGHRFVRGLSDSWRNQRIAGSESSD